MSTASTQSGCPETPSDDPSTAARERTVRRDTEGFQKHHKRNYIEPKFISPFVRC